MTSESATTTAKPKAARSGVPFNEGRDRIMAVAIKSFSERGYEGTTTAQVAREAGVTQPLIHHHFGSKEGLWRAAMDELFGGIESLAVADAATPSEELRASFEQFVRFVAARPEVTRVISREGAARSERLTYLVDRYLRSVMQRVVHLMQEGQRDGVIDPDLQPDLLLFFLLGAGSHIFDVTAFVQESRGVDTTSDDTLDGFVTLFNSVLQNGLFRVPPDRPSPS